jgi:hypothetical protein
VSLCDYCNEPVDYPFPVHQKCAQIWLKGYEAARQHYQPADSPYYR